MTKTAVLFGFWFRDRSRHFFKCGPHHKLTTSSSVWQQLEYMLTKTTYWSHLEVEARELKKKKQTTNQHSRFEKTHNTHSFIHRPQFLQNTSILELILLLRATVASQRTVQPGIIRALTAEYMRERITKPRWRNIFSDCNLAIGSFLKDTQFLFWHIWLEKKTQKYY